MSNFWRSPDLPLTNCEVELDLSWSRNYIKSEITRTAPVAGNPGPNLPIQALATTTTSATFQINNTKPYVPTVTLSINNNIKFLEHLNYKDLEEQFLGTNIDQE